VRWVKKRSKISWLFLVYFWPIYGPSLAYMAHLWPIWPIFGLYDPSLAYMTHLWPIFGLSMAYILEKVEGVLSQTPFVYFWPIYGPFLWPVFGLFLACFWPVFGLFLACFWPVFGLFLACFWPVFGLFLACFWRIYGTLLAYLRNIVGLFTEHCWPIYFCVWGGILPSTRKNPTPYGLLVY
jgi:hypothetical protein